MSCAGVEKQTKGAPVAPDVAVSCQLASRRQDPGEQIISSSQAAADKMGCFCCCSFREKAGLPGTSPVSSAYRIMCLSQANSHNCDANIAEAWRTAGAHCLPMCSFCCLGLIVCKTAQLYLHRPADRLSIPWVCMFASWFVPRVYSVCHGTKIIIGSLMQRPLSLTAGCLVGSVMYIHTRCTP